MKLNVDASQGNGHRANMLALFAALAGVIVFTLLFDPSIINPVHVGWLANGDPAQSYLGWLFFRQEPWSLPLGLTHTLGMEQASSIVYSDSIPLLAIFFKLWRAWLPSTFQYDGMWLCACYALQGYFASRLLMLFTDHQTTLTVGVLLFLLSPIMLFRAQPHMALTAQWIILAALYLYYVTPERIRLAQWLLLLWIAPLVHAYLMFMAYAIWGAYVLRHGVMMRRWPMYWTAAWVTVAICGSLLLMWLSGYFVHTDVSAAGFGYYSMNLLAPLLPIGAGPFLLHAPVPATTGQYEGFNYLGLGVLLALLFAASRAAGKWRYALHLGARAGWTNWRSQPDVPLILCCAALAALAITNQVTLGSHVLITIRLPGKLEAALNVFRASGRLFWPVYYVLLLAAIRGALSLSGPMCARLLVVVLLIQGADLFPFLRAVNASSHSNAVSAHFPVFPSPFWGLARSRYANLYVIPGQYKNDDNIAYESLANAHGFAIDTVYSARLPSASLQEPRTRRHEQFFEGVLDPRGLYLIQSSAFDQLASVQQLFPPSTGVGHVDGFTVVAPQWFTATGHGYLHGPKIHDFPEAVAGQTYHFGKGGDGQSFLLGGWSEPGDGATWSEGSSAALAMHVAPDSQDLKIVLNAEPYLPAAYPQLGVDVRMQGALLAHWQFERGKPGPSTTLVLSPAQRRADGNIVLSFSFDKARSPFESGESVDARKLALLLHSVSIQGR